MTFVTPPSGLGHTRHETETRGGFEPHNFKSLGIGNVLDSYSSAFSSQPLLDTLISWVTVQFDRFVSWLSSLLPSSWIQSSPEEVHASEKREERVVPIWDKAASLEAVRGDRGSLNALRALLEKALAFPARFPAEDVDEVVDAFFETQPELFGGEDENQAIAHQIVNCKAIIKEDDETDSQAAQRFLALRTSQDRWEILLEGICHFRLVPLIFSLRSEEVPLTTKCTALQKEFFSVDLSEPTIQARVKKDLRTVIGRVVGAESTHPFLNALANWMDRLTESQGQSHFPRGDGERYLDLVAYVQGEHFNPQFVNSALGYLFFDIIFGVFNRNEETVEVKLQHLRIGIEAASPAVFPELFRRLQYRVETEANIPQNTELYQELVAAVFLRDQDGTVEAYFGEHPEELRLQIHHFQGALVGVMTRNPLQFEQFVRLVVRSLPRTLQEVTRKREEAHVLAEELREGKLHAAHVLREEQQAQIQRDQLESERLEQEAQVRARKLAELMLMSDGEASKRQKVETLQRVLKEANPASAAHKRDVLSAFRDHNPELVDFLMYSIIEASQSYHETVGARIGEIYSAVAGRNEEIERAIQDRQVEIQEAVQARRDEEDFEEERVTAEETDRVRREEHERVNQEETDRIRQEMFEFEELDKLAHAEESHPHHIKYFSKERAGLAWKHYFSLSSYFDTSEWQDKVEAAVKIYLKKQFAAGTLDLKYLLGGIREYLR